MRGIVGRVVCSLLDFHLLQFHGRLSLSSLYQCRGVTHRVATVGAHVPAKNKLILTTALCYKWLSTVVGPLLVIC